MDYKTQTNNDYSKPFDKDYKSALNDAVDKLTNPKALTIDTFYMLPGTGPKKDGA